jgi:gliding motility-associated-like protein
MNIKALLFFVFISFYTVKAQTTAIPNAAFEQKLIDLSIDTNGLNGNILNTDAAAQTSLTLSGTTITNFTGLEAFVNVVTLDLGNNLFTTVPLNTLTALESLTFAGNDVITSLDVSQNVALKILNIQSNLSLAGDPPITTLNLANNTNLQDLQIARFGNLSNLTLPVTATLTKIRITYIADPTLNFSVCSGLKDLYIQESSVNTVITLPTVFTVLEKLNFSNINIPTIDLTNYSNLKDLNLSGTYVQNLLLPNSTTLEKIYILIHNLQGLQNFGSLPNLKELYLRANQTTPLTVNLSQNLQLTKLDLGDNDMSIINLTQNVALIDLVLDSNLFTNINITNNVNIKNLRLSYNLLPSINVTQNVLLENFSITNNLLPNLNVTQNINMWGLDISNNLFTGSGLNLTQNALLRYLKASFNQISSLNITQNSQMNSLILDHNLFTGTNIIQQYYDIRAASYGIGASQYFDVSFNQLSGPIPNIVGLISIGNNGVGANTNYYTLKFNNNNFHFGDFEAQHLTMISYLPLQNQWGNDIIRKYSYAPQAKVNLVENPTLVAGNSITLTTTVSGTQNHYKWFKNDVEIVGAPDSPHYVITSVNPCDAGVYHSEIRSDLVPFENANPPGTDGKNLLLIRNNITLTVTPGANICSNLTFPLNLATNVAVNPNITWSDSPNACSYTLNVGTTSGGIDILNGINVGNVNNYLFTSNLPINTTIYVTIIANFTTGVPQTCPVQSFTTGSTIAAVPSCITTVSPLNNALNIPVNQNFSWTPVANATGYTVAMGTTPSGSQIVGTTNLTTNTFNPTLQLPQGQIVYLTITPYNVDGNAIGCSAFQFSVETIPSPPTCPTSYSITNGQTNVNVNLGGISWTSVSSQTEYFVSIGIIPGGTDFVNDYFNNTSEYFDLTGLTFAYSTTYYLTIRVRDQSTGTSNSNCTSIQFTTQPAPAVVPTCTTLIFPSSGSTNIAINSDVSWTAIANATGYFISIGTTSGGTDFVNNFDNGNSTTFNPTSNFGHNVTYFVTITPYNTTGNAVGCTSQSFTTEIIITVPNCTIISSPSSGSTNIAINSDVTWTSIANATGYFISIGTTSGGTDVLNNFDNGNLLTYNPASDFTQNTTYFVTITPYNATGNASGCIETQFTTQTIATIPSCVNNIFPANSATDIAIKTNITWTTVPNATGYFISIGTTSGGTDFVNNFDNGSSLVYNPTTDFNQNTVYFVTITPYNVTGNAASCSEIQFTTESTLITDSEISIPKFFTPNNDGFNDVWNIKDPKNEVKSIFIFDRYGKLMKQIAINDSWNGMYNSQLLPSMDYWYTIELKDNSTLRGHFTLKR